MEGIIFHLHLEGKKLIRMSCFFFFTYFDIRQTGNFSVTDPFLTTFYYVEKRNGILRKNRGEGFKKILRTLTWVWGSQKLAKSCLRN